MNLTEEEGEERVAAVEEPPTAAMTAVELDGKEMEREGMSVMQIMRCNEIKMNNL